MAKQALTGRRINGFAMDPKDLVLIGLDTDHTRRGEGDGAHPCYDDRVKQSLDEALVLNVMRNGVLQPVTVQKFGDDAVVIMGRQRVRAAREANRRLEAQGSDLRRSVPVMVNRGNDDGKLFSVMVSENTNRRGYDPLEKARLVSEFISSGFGDEKEAAIQFGLTRPMIVRMLQLNASSPGLKALVNQGKISATAATTIAKNEAYENQERVAQKAIDEGTATVASTVSKARTAAKSGSGRGFVAPSKKLLNQVVASEQAKEVLSEDFLDGIRFAIGAVSAEDLRSGMPGLIDDVKTRNG